MKNLFIFIAFCLFVSCGPPSVDTTTEVIEATDVDTEAKPKKTRKKKEDTDSAE